MQLVYVYVILTIEIKVSIINYIVADNYYFYYNISQVPNLYVYIK